jgi:hypothetical protein
MKNAIALMHWYLDEALRLQEINKVDVRLQDAQELLDWLQKQPTPLINCRTIVQNGPNKFRSSAKIEPLLELLIKHKLIVEVVKRPRRFRIWTPALSSTDTGNVVPFPAAGSTMKV